MKRIIYEAPDGSLLFDPTPAQLTEILRHADAEYWLQGADGEAALRVADQPGDGREASHAVLTHAGIRVEYAAGEPELWIKQPEPGRFFFTWNDRKGWVVPYDGTGCAAFVLDERGGDPFKIPRACLVGRAEAVEVVGEFLRSHRRAEVIRWLPWSELPLPEDW